MGNLGVGPGFSLSEPNANSQLGSRLQGDWHLDVTSTKAEVGYGTPERSSLDVNLDRVLASETGSDAVFDTGQLKVIDCVRGQGEVPERFLGSDVEQADVACFWCSGTADPLYTEVHSIGAVG